MGKTWISPTANSSYNPPPTLKLDHVASSASSNSASFFPPPHGSPYLEVTRHHRRSTKHRDSGYILMNASFSDSFSLSSLILAARAPILCTKTSNTDMSEVHTGRNTSVPIARSLSCAVFFSAANSARLFCRAFFFPRALFLVSPFPYVLPSHHACRGRSSTCKKKRNPNDHSWYI